MKLGSLIKLFMILILLMISCKREANVEMIKPQKTASIDTLDVISFRRSYVDHHLLSEKEYEKLFELNPVLENYSENIYRKEIFQELNKIKIIEIQDSTFTLNLKYFENFNPKEIKYLDSKSLISFDYELDLTKSNSILLKVENDGFFVEKKIDFSRGHFIGMTLEDVDKDGIKEIMILLNYYIMNGDNYILMINKFVN